VSCSTNAEKGGVIDYRVTAKKDVFLDLRLGPVKDRVHGWKAQWVKGRAMRCLPSVTMETNPVESTPCSLSEFDQLPLGWAGRGVTYFRVMPCNPTCAPTACTDAQTRANDALCIENFTLYADDCDAIEIREITPDIQSDVEMCPRLGMNEL
jgi:hypothetical protein